MLAERQAERKGWFRRQVGRLRRLVDRCLAGACAGLFPDQPKVGTGPAEEPEARAVNPWTIVLPPERHEPPNEKAIWNWSSKWSSWDDMHWDQIDVPSFQIDRILVAVGIVDSRSNAQRLIKGGGVTWRRDDRKMEWEKVKDFKQEVEPGTPWVLRVGDGHWRSILVEVEGRDGKPVAKPKQMPGITTVMRPQWNEGTEEDGTPWRVFQSRDVWDTVWRPDREEDVAWLCVMEFEHEFFSPKEKVRLQAEREECKKKREANASMVELGDTTGREPVG